MKKWLSALTRTREKWGAGIKKVLPFTGRVDEDELEDLEASLIAADIPVAMVMEWIEQIRDNKEGADLRGAFRRSILDAIGDDYGFSWAGGEGPCVMLMIGVNGSGKTTTSAKLAWLAQQNQKSPLLAAGDTFRAAGTDQLRLWADKVDCEIVAGVQGADAAAVVYDAVSAGQARRSDYVIIDTAGRMHTKFNLMKELEKVHRAVSKAMPGAPHEVWIVLDASLGNNALLQAKAFHESVPLTGVVVTKLDGSSKAGFILSVKRELGVPIRFIGLGEEMQDLVSFDPDAYADAILGGEQDD